MDMRGNDAKQDELFSYISIEKRVPSNHPLRRIRAMTDTALQRMSKEFDALYARLGRPSIPPERLLRALLVQALYSVRSERQLMERLEYDLLFRWFVGLQMDERVWDVTVFTKNRDRLLDGKIAELFFDQVLAQADEQQLLSDEHFTVDGTLIEAWANRRSFQEKKEPPEKGSGRGGKKLLRDTHESETDPEARLYKKSTAGEAKPGFLGHLVMENRNGLVLKP
jgi:transposase